MEWKNVPIKMFSHYEISNTGQVRLNGRIRKLETTKNGYKTVALYSHCKYKRVLVHRLVAMAFIPTKDITLDINHIDGNKKNNCVSNLEWCTRGENLRHAFRLGLKKNTEKQREAARKTGKITCHKNRRHTPVACYKNGEIVKRFDSIHDAFRFLGSTVSGAINMCCDGKKKTYKGYTWRRV